MDSWTVPALPLLSRMVPQPPPSVVELSLYDSARQGVYPTGDESRRRTMYVCGITPYDATHLGHAATMITFDLVNRMWRDAGLEVSYVQNVTDVDDPLLERAERDGKDWVMLAMRETALFREDMAALRILPPAHYVGAVESMPSIMDRVAQLLASGLAYYTDDGTGDIYFDLAAAPRFGYVSHLDAATMTTLFAERGGDPDRPGKRNTLDPLLWRGARDDEPSWHSTVLGPGRPGWHIECAAIALDRLGDVIDVQGGGSDLCFPHHECSSAHAEALTGLAPFARHYVHAGMIGLGGAKMSKSRGNLVFVAALRAGHVEPMAVRLSLLSTHYRTDRQWTDDVLAEGRKRLATWQEAVAAPSGPSGAALVQDIRAALANDLDTVLALSLVDSWCAAALAGVGDDRDAPRTVADAVDALLGVLL